MSNKSKIKKRRDRNTLTFYEKIAVIRHHEANQLSRNNLARMFQCCTTQIRRIIDHKDEILAQWEEMCHNNAPAVIEEMSKKRREFELKAVGFILHRWVERCRELKLNVVINDAMLKLIATKTATVLNIKEFKPTARWLERFRLKFKYKDDNLESPRSIDDPQGTLSVEDIIIEYKDFLPSFMRQEISNITSNNIETATATVSIENLKDKQSPNKMKESDFEESLNREDDDDSPIAAEHVLQHLSFVKQFFKSNADYQAMDVTTHLQNYLEESYILSSVPSSPMEQQQTDLEVDESFVVLIE